VQGTLPEDLLPGLKPLLKTAVERSPSTILASISMAQQEAVKYFDSQGLWPSLNGDAQYAVTDASVANSPTSTEKGIFYGVNFNQPVFQWGASKNNAAIGSLGVKIAQRQYAEAYRNLATQIREQYMAIVAKKIDVRNARYRRKIAEEALATDQAKFDAGSVSQAELQGFKVDFEQRDLDADRSTEDYNYLKRVFTRLVGIDELDEDSIPLEIGHPEYSAALADAVLTGFVGDGIESAFQNEVYKMMVAQQDLSYSIAKVRLLPKLNAAASYNLFDQATAFAGHVSQVAERQATYSLVANWSIFDGFATRGAKLQALATKRYYERVRKTYVDNTVDQVSYLRHQVGLSSRALSLSELHHALIESAVKRIMDDLKLGYASQASVETSTLDLYVTEYDMANARTDYFSRWTEFVSLAGADPAISNLSPRYVR
jgi:outer membrane protein TolC